jgi:hypothetical protein
MGIPCSHTIRHLIEVNLKVSAAHFDAFWLYDRPVPAPLVPDPLHDVPAQQIFRVLLYRQRYYHLSKYAQRVVHGRMIRLQSASHQRGKGTEVLALLQ